MLKITLFSFLILSLLTSCGSYRYEMYKPYMEAEPMWGNLETSEIFSLRDGKLPPREGSIVNERYFAPKNVFSCKAYNFGKDYITQDGLDEVFADVSFYDNKNGNFNKCEMTFIKDFKKRSESDLKDYFERVCLYILKEIDSAVGIRILNEEMIDDMYFVSMSIDKMNVLRDDYGRCLSSTRGYLVFQATDRMVILTIQKATPRKGIHNPEIHIDTIKKEIIEFKNSIEFGSWPAISINAVGGSESLRAEGV